ncbi:MAG: hypothetical protein R2809_12335 [Flavobacteriales bacterium]
MEQGRVVYQDLVKINIAIREGEFQKMKPSHRRLNMHQPTTKSSLTRLASDGGVHSHIDHLIALSGIANSGPNVNTFIHAFTDGRDTDLKSGLWSYQKSGCSYSGGQRSDSFGMW